MARRSGEQEHDEESARCLVEQEQEQEQEHGEGRAQRLKQVSPGLCCSEDGEGVWRLRCWRWRWRGLESKRETDG